MKTLTNTRIIELLEEELDHARYCRDHANTMERVGFWTETIKTIRVAMVKAERARG